MSGNQKKETFAQRLVRLMTACSLTQSELAKRTGIDRTQINRMVNGKAHPKPHQIGWLAQYLCVTVDELLAGIDWPPEVHRAIDESLAAIQRVVEAEAQRDEAVARAAALDAQVARERDEHERALQEAAATLRASDEQSQARLHEQERKAVSDQNVLRAEIDSLKSLLRQGAAAIQQLQSTEAVLRTQLASTQKQLANTRANKAAGQLFAGLAGAVIGRAID